MGLRYDVIVIGDRASNAFAEVAVVAFGVICPWIGAPLSNSPFVVLVSFF